MANSPFGINVVSRSHAVVCSACNSRMRQVAERCPSCGTALAATGFSIVDVGDRDARPLRARFQVRRATVA